YAINQKRVVVIDQFFSDSEGLEMRKYTESLDFSAGSFSNDAGLEKGEIRAKCLPSEKLFEFMIEAGISAQQYIYQLFAYIGTQMNAVASTQRWKSGE